MANPWFQLREGSVADLPALASLDSSFSNEWVLHLDRLGGPIEQTIELRWRRAKPAGSTRRFEVDDDYPAADHGQHARFLVAESDGRLVGYLRLREKWNGTAEIESIVVDLPYRRHGLGRRLVEEAEAYARERDLRAVEWETQTDNRAAIEFALAQGFRIAGFHDALYRNRGHEEQLEPDFRGLAVFLTKELK